MSAGSRLSPVPPAGSRIPDAVLVAVAGLLAIGGGLAVGTGSMLPLEAGAGAVALFLAGTTFTTIGATAPLVLFALTVMPATFAWPLVTIVYFATGAAVVWMLLMGDDQSLPVGVLAVLAVPLLSYVVNQTGIHVLLQGMKPAIGFAGAAWLAIVLARRDPRVFGLFLQGLQLFSILVGLLAVYQYATDTWPIIDQLSRNGHAPGRSAGVFCHPIVLGTFTVSMIVLAWNRRDRLWELVLVANAAGLVLSGSRGAWVAMGIVVAVQVIAAPLRNRRGVEPWRVVATAAMAVLAIGTVTTFAPGLVSGLKEQAQFRLSSDTAQASAKARDTRNELGRSLIFASPKSALFGHGNQASANYWAGRDLHDKGASTWDNTYITLGYDYGLIGALLLLGPLAWGVLAPGGWTGRMLLLGLGVQLWTYDATGWPTVAALVALGFACRYVPRDDADEDDGAEFADDPDAAEPDAPRRTQLQPA